MTDTTPESDDQRTPMEPLEPIDPETDDSGVYPTDKEVLDDPEVDTDTEGEPEVVISPRSP